MSGKTASVPAVAPPRPSAPYNPSTVQHTRTSYYTTVYRDRYIPPPMGATYGSFSETFMWAMMWNAAFAHNHASDPAYLQWRRDAEERARNDERVRIQLAELDAKVNAMKGQPVDPAYVPHDVPPEAMFSDSALKNAEPEEGHITQIILGLAMVVMFGGLLVYLFLPSRRLA